MPAEPEKVARPTAGDGREQKQAHLPVAGRHAKQEHGPERKQAKRAVDRKLPRVDRKPADAQPLAVHGEHPA